jgi:erythromycin esterase
VWLIPLSAYAQQFYNFGFEYSTPNGYPRAWLPNEGTGSSTIRVDSTVAYQGKSSLKFTAINSPMLLAGLLLPIEKITGKTITLSGYIRTDSLQNGMAQLLYYDYGTRKFGFSPDSASLTTDWKWYEYTFEVAPGRQGEGIAMGIKVNGTGIVYLDAFQITINGQPLEDRLPQLRELRREELTWLNKESIPFQSIDPTATHTDLQPFKKLIGNARLVGLGENSHGSGSIFKLKHRLIQFLVEEMGFTILAMEAPAPEADKINEYVLQGKGSLEQVAQYLGFKSWQTREVLDMIQWMRKYNQLHATPIQFKGIDIQSRQVAIETLTLFAKEHDSGLLPALDTINTLLNTKPLSDSILTMAYQKATLLRSAIETNSKSKYAQVKSTAMNQVVRDAMILMQYIGLPLYKKRRECMAINIQWLMDHQAPGTKMVIWAHNDHVSKDEANMGWYVARQYGNDYISFGFTFDSGQYAAYGPEKYYQVLPSYRGTYEYYLSKGKHTQFALDIRKANQQQSSRWLAQPMDFRSLGAAPETNQFREITLTHHFDIVIYLKETAHSVYLNP